MKTWFSTLGYGFESHNHVEGKHFEWIVTIPTRRNYERIFVRGVEREADINDVIAVRNAVQKYKVDEGWVVAPRRVSQLAKLEVQKSINEHNVYCYTFDELIDQEVDFSKYFEWLEQQVEKQRITTLYVPLSCSKEEIDSITKKHLGISSYNKENGWIDGYINRWLDDPSKEHISILGEFGTGKTWFALHYSWALLQKYLKAKKEGTERPRLPLVIPLRDYAKAVSVESLFSEFFFRKHQIELRGGYPTFEQLNRMGKLLLIFDGFDEMAARVSWQDMINNFWELAKVVIPGAKAVLTCRTEHFPEAREGRSILNAELKASTANLTGEPPQFEVLELDKLDNEQIREVLSLQTNLTTVNKVMRNPQLVDLARRPVMIDLIIEALPSVETGKKLDIARVYLYAIWRKMQRDIKQERTFTSMADKLYFLCELAWEMLSTDKLSLNYRDFPERIRYLFGAAVQEQRDLDHWHYDMMGQTILTRNSAGDYTFAHRSFLEFFVAYKTAAELGILTNDFIEVFQQEFSRDEDSEFRDCTWSQYFQNQNLEHPSIVSIPKINLFSSEDISVLRSGFGRISLATAEQAILELLEPMIDKSEATTTKLLEVIEKTKGMKLEEAGYLGGNAVTLLLKCHNDMLSGKDLSHSVIVNSDFTTANLYNTNFTSAHLNGCVFAQTFGSIFSLIFSPREGENLLALGDATGSIRLFNVNSPQNHFIFKGHQGLIRSIAFSPDGETLASGSEDGSVRLWNISNGNCFHVLDQHTRGVRSVAFSPDGETLASGSEDGSVRLWNISNGNCFHVLDQHTKGVRSVAFSPDGETLASGSEDGSVRLWNISNGNCFHVLDQHTKGIWTVLFDSNDRVIASGADGLIILWDHRNNVLNTLQGHTNRIRSIAIDRNRNILASGSEDKTIRLWNIYTGSCITILEGHKNWIRSVAISSDGKLLASGSEDQVIKIWSISEARCLKTLVGSVSFTKAVAFDKDGKMLASSSQENSIKLWSIDSTLPHKILLGHASFVRSLSFSSDSAKIISGSDDGTIKLWDIKTGTHIKTLIGHVGWVNSVASSTENNLAVSGGEDKIVRVWDITSGRCLRELNEHTDGIRVVSFCLEGRRIASGSADRSIKIWDVISGKCITTLEGHQDWVISVAFSHCGRLLATGSSGKNIKIWDLEFSRQLLDLNGHQDWVYSVTFTSDNSSLVSSSRDGTIRIWDVASGRCVKVIAQGLLPLSSSFNSDGSVVACGCEDGAIRLWDIKEGINISAIYDRAYEGMNIFDVKGLTSPQIATLKDLGAIDESVP